MFRGLFPLLVVAGIALVVVRVSRGRTGSGPPGSGGVAARRFFQYVLALAVLVIGALGLSGLIAAALPGGERSSAELARWLAFTVVAVPSGTGLAIHLRKTLDGDAAERASLGWALYLNAALAAALAVVMVAGVATLRWAVRIEDFEQYPCAALIVWSGVWLLHWRAASRWATGRLQAHTALGSVAGVALTGAAGWLASAAGLAWLYESLFEGAEPVAVSEGVRAAAALALVGLPVWWWYWWRRFRVGGRTVLWYAYVLLIGVLGSLVTGVVAASIVLYTLVAWVIGDPDAAVLHFDVVPLVLPGIAFGALGWWYYRGILRPARPVARAEVDRVYDYLVAGAGLLTATAGATVLGVACIEWLVPSGWSGSGASTASTPALAVTLLVVGLPLWWVAWARARRAVAADPVVEAGSAPRRVYLVVLFGLTAVTALISLIVALVRCFTDLFDGRFGAETIGDVRVAVALVVTMGVLAGSHWVVYSRDRSLASEGAAGERPAVRDVVLLAAATRADGIRLAALTGVRVRVWGRPGAAGAVPAEEIAELLRAETHESVVVLVDDHRVEVIPYEAR